MKKFTSKTNALSVAISKAVKKLSKAATNLWQLHKEFMSENPSYRELFNLAIAGGTRLLRISPVLALAVAALLATFASSEGDGVWV